MSLTRVFVENNTAIVYVGGLATFEDKVYFDIKNGSSVKSFVSICWTYETLYRFR